VQDNPGYAGSFRDTPELIVQGPDFGRAILIAVPAHRKRVQDDECGTTLEDGFFKALAVSQRIEIEGRLVNEVDAFIDHCLVVRDIFVATRSGHRFQALPEDTPGHFLVDVQALDGRPTHLQAGMIEPREPERCIQDQRQPVPCLIGSRMTGHQHDRTLGNHRLVDVRYSVAGLADEGHPRFNGDGWALSIYFGGGEFRRLSE
jgi:hypothetical protein